MEIAVTAEELDLGRDARVVRECGSGEEEPFGGRVRRTVPARDAVLLRLL